MVFRNLIIRIAAIGLLAAPLFAALSTRCLADDTLVRQFPSGGGSDAVGIIDGSQDVELMGPQALSSDGTGNLFMLDQVNGRIVRFDPKKPTVEPSILKMPENVKPSDLVVRNNDIMVWDG